MFKKTSDVFGISNSILEDSYIDRGKKDLTIQKLLDRPVHIALKGESKCGKSWLRQKNIKNPITIQCRYNKNVNDIYVDALSQLDINFTLNNEETSKISGKIEAESEIGLKLLAKAKLIASVSGELDSKQSLQKVGRDINDLRYIADIIKTSGRRLVIEDFHYLSLNERKRFSYELKALWDYGCFVIIIGVWSESNMLCTLNSDLSGRITEESIYWSESDLKEVIKKGCDSLNIDFSDEIITRLIADCYENVGILQKLILLTLDKANIYEEQQEYKLISNISYYEEAASTYADQLNSIYINFAKRLSKGFRKRGNSTGIYAHAMAVITESSDHELIHGLNLDTIYDKAHSREPRIQRHNLDTVLQKLEQLQVDEDNRGLVVAYDISCNDITAVDRQLLFYRKNKTVKWPWEDMINDLESKNSQAYDEELD